MYEVKPTWFWRRTHLDSKAVIIWKRKKNNFKWTDVFNIINRNFFYEDLNEDMKKYFERPDDEYATKRIPIEEAYRRTFRAITSLGDLAFWLCFYLGRNGMGVKEFYGNISLPVSAEQGYMEGRDEYIKNRGEN